MHKKAGRRVRWGRSLGALLVLAAAFFVGWGYIAPLLATGSETLYYSYTAKRGDILTHKSFSASIDVLNSETHNNGDDVSSIRNLYVSSGQQVKDGDKLLQLDTGEIFRAGLDGTVNEMRFGEGDWLWPRVQIIQICDLKNLQVTLQVDEYDVDKVAAGQSCTVTIVPLGIDFETQIKHVNRLSSASGSVAYYDVTAELTVPEHVLPGMTASVSIPDTEARDAVVLEMEALAFDEEDKPYVWVQSGETYEKHLLETGLSDGMLVEITSGLSEGDVVYRAYEQELQPQGFTLASLYKRIVGENVVINDQSGMSIRGGAMSGGRQLPQGTERSKTAESSENPLASQRPETNPQSGGGTK